MQTKLLLTGGLIVGAVAVFAIQLTGQVFQPTPSQLPTGVTTTTEQEDQEEPMKPTIELIADNLNVPWEVEFLPDQNLLITERPGTLIKFNPETKQRTEIAIPSVREVGESGLLGLALHPNFAQNNWLYLYLTTEAENGLINRVERYEFNNDQLQNKQIIIDQIPGARYHDGGRIAFGSDGYLYITTGDATNPDSAQDIDSLAGKILRLRDNGNIPENNPFQNPVFTYGHRNPQGITWDQYGQMWSTEHGRSGIRTGLDELNLISYGENYGWPVIQGDETQAEMTNPFAHSGPDETWAPADALAYNGSIYWTGLRGESLYQAKLDNNNQVTEIIAHFRGEYGRLRALQLSPDGYFYLTTSNTDGRGDPAANDDRLFKIDPIIFTE